MAWSCRSSRHVAACCLQGIAAANFLLAYAFALHRAVPDGIRHPWLHAVEIDGSRRAQMQAIVALTCDPGRPLTVNIVGGDYPALNHFSANFHAALAYAGSPPCRFASLGFALEDAQDALERLRRQSAVYYIAHRPDRTPPANFDHLNRVSAAVLAEVTQSRSWEKVNTLQDAVVFRSRSAFQVPILVPE
jgi:hypothetical protein